MKKYKLIKTYPGSQTLGSIVTGRIPSDAGAQISRYIDSSGNQYGWHSVEDYPEFWEEIKELQFKVGDWVTNTDPYYSTYPNINHFMIRITKTDGNLIKGYGWEYTNRWVDEKNCGFVDNGGLRLATTEEVEKHLKEEAKKKGFVKGVAVIRPKGMECRTIETLTDDKIWYTEDNLVINGVTIYQYGKWAEITKEEQIKIGEYVAKFEYPSSGRNTISFGCKKYTFEEVKELYNICLVFGINQIYAHNHLIDYILLKRIYDKITK